MMPPLIVILVALTAGLVFVSLRRYELARGARFFDSSRARLDEQATTLWGAAVLGGIPLAWRKFALAVIHEVTHEVVHRAVTLVRAVERPLARLSYKMRISTPKGVGAPVSDFLRTISPEKK